MAVSALKLRIEGMDCGACAVKIENAMQRLPGVSDINVSYSAASLALNLDEDRTSRATIKARINVTGLTMPTKQSISGGGDVTLEGGLVMWDVINVVRVTCTHTGRVRISFSHKGVTGHTEFNIT